MEPQGVHTTLLAFLPRCENCIFTLLCENSFKAFQVHPAVHKRVSLRKQPRETELQISLLHQCSNCSQFPTTQIELQLPSNSASKHHVTTNPAQPEGFLFHPALSTKMPLERPCHVLVTAQWLRSIRLVSLLPRYTKATWRTWRGFPDAGRGRSVWFPCVVSPLDRDARLLTHKFKYPRQPGWSRNKDTRQNVPNFSPK